VSSKFDKKYTKENIIEGSVEENNHEDKK
jgi:hypothetical protein